MTKQHVTDRECVTVLRAYAKYNEIKRAAASIKMPWSTFKRIRDAGIERGLTADTPMPEDKDAEIRELQEQIKALQVEGDTAATIRDRVYELAALSPAPPKWIIEPKKGSSSGVPMVMCSDLHWGEVVKAVEVGGVNEYSLAIARARLKLLFEKIIDLCVNHMTKPRYPGIIFCLGGDIITGDIHEELSETNEMPTLAVLLDVQEHLIAGITSLADVFGKVFIPCVVGNHGRNTRKPRMKSRVHTSYEWNLYCQLERHFKAKGDDRVQFFIPGETDAYFTVYGHRFLLTHGDSLGVKGGDGIIGALGPIMRGAIKTGRSEAEIGRDFDTLIIGHWHQYVSTRGLIVNNCLKGYDEFAKLALRAPATPASQALWFVHPKWGITARWEVLVQDPNLAGRTKAKEWISWQA